MKSLIKKITFPPYFRCLRWARQKGLLKKPVIKVCISTNVHYASKTIPALRESLLSAGFSNEEIYVVEGGHERDEASVNHQNHFLVRQNSFDLTALIFLCDLDVSTDYWFLLHDTCIVGKNFKYLIENIPHYWPEVIPMKNYPAMNIGAYSNTFLHRKRPLLQSLANFDQTANGLTYAKLEAIDKEDILFKQNDIKKKVWVYNPWLLLGNEGYGVAATNLPSYYTNRIKEYYPQVDLFKYKALRISIWLRKNVLPSTLPDGYGNASSSSSPVVAATCTEAQANNEMLGAA